MNKMALECANTFIYPAKALWKHEGVKILLLAIAILAICAHHVETAPMEDFNNAISDLGEFIKNNPCFMSLIGTLCGLLYIAIGRELVNYEKTPLYKVFREPFYQNHMVSEQCLTTLVWLPIVIAESGKHRECAVVAAVVLIGITILALCAEYAQTEPMEHFNKGLTEVKEFLNHPEHASLIGVIVVISYLIIGREYSYSWQRQHNPQLYTREAIEQIEEANGPSPPSYASLFQH